MLRLAPTTSFNVAMQYRQQPANGRFGPFPPHWVEKPTAGLSAQLPFTTMASNVPN